MMDLRHAVTFMPEQTTIIGPPGTGKTTKLASEIARAVGVHGPDRVLVASLTKTAAVEIAGRGIPVDREHVGTLHALCYRALGRPKLVYPTVAEFNRQYDRNLSAGSPDLDDLAADTPAEESGDDRACREMELYRARLTPRELWPEYVRSFAVEWDAWKAFTGMIDFTDMIERTLQHGGPAPDDPAVIFYDEAQDGSALELALLSQWAEHAEHTVLAGDDRQALYVWRGASVERFLGWSDRKIQLARTYRYGAEIHRYAQAWASQLAVTSVQAYKPADVPGTVEQRPYVIGYPEEWISEVEDRVAAGQSIMLLATCGYMLTPLLATLRQRAIPFHNPYRTRRGDWNPLAVRQDGKGPAARILAFTRLAATGQPWRWCDLWRWTEHLRAEVLPRGSKTRIAEHRDEQSVVPFGVVDALLGREVMGAALRGALDWYADSLLDSRRQRFSYVLAVAERRGIAALQRHVTEVQGRPGTGLMLGTVHSVKGGEADAVYLWPDLSQAAMVEYVEPAQRDNVLRTLYVGMTRARRTLVLGQASSRQSVQWLPVEGS